VNRALQHCPEGGGFARTSRLKDSNFVRGRESAVSTSCSPTNLVSPSSLASALSGPNTPRIGRKTSPSGQGRLRSRDRRSLEHCGRPNRDRTEFRKPRQFSQRVICEEVRVARRLRYNESWSGPSMSSSLQPLQPSWCPHAA
jgi:hypothetical protein